MRLRLIAVLLFVLACAPVANTQAIRWDGNRWNGVSDDVKVPFVFGIFAGIRLGPRFAALENATQNAETARCVIAVAEAFTKRLTDYSKVSVGQVTDGLDVFYKDYRNRSILVDRAMWYVLNDIAGTPKPELDKMLADFRKNPG